MKKLKIMQVGIGHDHAIATYNSILKQSDIFDLVGLVLCDGEKEKFGKGLLLRGRLQNNIKKQKKNTINR